MLESPGEFCDDRGSKEGKVAAFAFRGRIDHDVRGVRGFGVAVVDGQGEEMGAVGQRVKMFILGFGAGVGVV